MFIYCYYEHWHICIYKTPASPHALCIIYELDRHVQEYILTVSLYNVYGKYLETAILFSCMFCTMLANKKCISTSIRYISCIYYMSEKLHYAGISMKNDILVVQFWEINVFTCILHITFCSYPEMKCLVQHLHCIRTHIMRLSGPRTFWFVIAV